MFVQAETRQGEHEQIHSQGMERQLTNTIKQISSLSDIKWLLEFKPFVNQLLQAAKATLHRVQTCKPKARIELLRLAASHLGDFEGCINVTRDFADFEQFILHTFQYGIVVDKTLFNISRDAFYCHTQPDVFEVLRCIVTTLKDSGPQLDKVLDSALGLIGEVQNDTKHIFTHFKSCFSFNKTAIITEVVPLIYTHC